MDLPSNLYWINFGVPSNKKYAIRGLTINGMGNQMDLIVDDQTANYIIVWMGFNNME